MTPETIKEIVGHIATPGVTLGAGVRPLVHLPPGWKDSTPGVPQVEPLTLATLTGLRDYLSTNVDSHAMADLLLVVKGPDSVYLGAKLEGPEADYRRHCYALAKAPALGFRFGEYLDAETFMVGLQTQFCQTKVRDDLLALLASIRDSDVRETVDDGVAQEVKTARGVALVDRTRVPNPVVLAPYRTFREVAQPASAFVLRLRGGEGERPRAALHEADGGAWRLDATQAVAEWLRVQVPPVAVVA